VERTKLETFSGTTRAFDYAKERNIKHKRKGASLQFCAKRKKNLEGPPRRLWGKWWETKRKKKKPEQGVEE